MEVSHENRQSSGAGRALIFAFFLTLVYFIIELAGGLLTRSLALIADSSHMAGDVISLAFAFWAQKLARRPTNLVKTFGYHRVEVLAGLFNAMALWVVSGMILSSAIKRLQSPPEVLAGPMITVASVGLLVNLICAGILKKSSRSNLNIRGAYLHVLSDALGSLGAIIGGTVMKLTGWYTADPLASLVICLLIVISSFKLMTNSLNILLEGVPPHLNTDDIRAELLKVDGVKDVHDLHVWSLGSGMDMLSGHLTLISQADRRAEGVLKDASRRLSERFGIEHATLQPEFDI